MWVGCGLVRDASPPRDRDAGIDAARPDAFDPLAPDAFDPLAPDAFDPLAPDAFDPLVPDANEGEVDAHGFADPCDGLDDGDECSRGGPSRLICLRGGCVPSFCGDGFVDSGAEEQCEPALDPNCDPRACRRDCTLDADCDEPSECAIASCASGTCRYEAVAGEPPCRTADGTMGTCGGGLCLPNGCGNLVIETALGEECEGTEGCVACRFECRNGDDCSDGDPCNGLETCEILLEGTATRGRRCAPGDAPECVPMQRCHVARCVPVDDVDAICEETLIDVDGDGFSAGPDCGSFGGDCDDEDASRNPSAVEACNLIDDDCDGATDEEMAEVDWCLDGDGDGFGDPLTTLAQCAAPGEGYVRDCTDCWDTSDPPRRAEAALVHPGQRAFFPVPYCPTADTCVFDYDCDRFDERAELRISTCSTLRLGLCDRGDGWQGSAPACGDDGMWVDCRGLAAVCGVGRSTRVQTCR